MNSPSDRSASITSLSATVRTAAVGLAMGAADIVPGVSGGTVALILGVYHRLLNALSHIDAEAIRLVVKGRFGAAWRRIDGGFLVALAVGILAGAKGLASVMHYLLTEQQTFTYAAFFGLILASGLLVARLAKPETPAQAARELGLAVLAAAFAVWLMSRGRLTPAEGALYTFGCGAIAICAMILPGVSGAYLLLVLGKYEEVSEIIHRAPHFAGNDLTTLAAFGTGCLFGLLAFSRVLKWLLARHGSPTMAVLAGFMIGSLYRIWPFQVDTTPGVEEFKLKMFEPTWPAAGGQALACLGIAVGAFMLVMIAEALGRRRATTD